MEKWDQTRLQKLIDDQEPESLRLEYKGKESIGKNNKETDEITKDISAMANSDGGIVIFGISRHDQDKTRPKAIEPIDAHEFSAEWLGQKIDLISPRVEREIIPVEIGNDPTKVIYVVIVPKSDTAHQATDHRYYKRYDTRCVPMNDYDIRDVMGRSKYPKIECRFQIVVQEFNKSNLMDYNLEHNKPEEKRKYTSYELNIAIINTGKVYAQYIHIEVGFPCVLLESYFRSPHFGAPPLPAPTEDETRKYYYTELDNTTRDVTKKGYRVGGMVADEYGPTRYVPILPDTARVVKTYQLTQYFEEIEWNDLSINWIARADNAPPNQGKILIRDIKLHIHEG